ncbi:MAG: carboxypeptidase-like regulatory domain-containing protein [Lachnospiraceae bacterium]|nr:carboxypeptidase-like regulatory domain-containing protein [Lachnospiraceae bacterium]
MKKRLIIAIIAAAVLTSACGLSSSKKDIAIVDSLDSAAATEADWENDGYIGPVEQGIASNDSFDTAAAYIKNTEGKVEAIDYSETKYNPGERDDSESYDAASAAVRINSAISGYSLKRIKTTRADADGAVFDLYVWTDTTTNNIAKIVSIEYGSSGRDVKEFYYDNAALRYVYEYSDNIYGTAYKASYSAKGKKCTFKDDAMVRCENTENGVTYNASDYINLDAATKTEYDDLEKNLVNRAYINYTFAASHPGIAKISGYAAHEDGGTLKNVHVTITSTAHSYSTEVVSNDDGYYEAYVPVNTDDWYNIKYTYGDYPSKEIDDISIRPGTVEYCPGVVYMTPEGEVSAHKNPVYLLDVSSKAPGNLADDEFEIVTTYESNGDSVTPVLYDLKKGEKENKNDVVVKISSDTEFKYYLTDAVNAKNGTFNSSAMSLTGACVKIYNKDGIVASFQIPANSLGAVWEVFEIDGGTIIPANNYYQDAVTEPLFS